MCLIRVQKNLGGIDRSIDDVTYKRLFIDWKIIANRVAIDFELTFLELREAFYQTNNVAVSVTRLADFSVKISY